VPRKQKQQGKEKLQRSGTGKEPKGSATLAA
jgi:hypothetical protein